MATTIVVPLDGSALAERALPYAKELARPRGGRLVLVRAALARTLPGLDPTDAQVSVTALAERELESVADRLRAEGLMADAHVYYDEAARAILDAADAQHAAVVVMSTHGRSGPGRFIYGSVADRVLRGTRLPTLLVPATCERPWPTDGPLHVLVPLDSSEFAEEALAHVIALTGDRDVVLHLLYVVEPPTPLLTYGSYVPVFDPGPELARARYYLEVVARRFPPGRLVPMIDTIVGEPVLAICAAARNYRADLIALATHGRGGLARLLLGSVATGVLQRASVPVLLIRPTAVQAAATATTAPAVETAAPPVLVALSPPELAIVQQALEAVLRDAEQEAGARVGAAAGAQCAGELLARLKQAETVATP
jgi:nucleotide-binding universal stress UspA family protein